MIDWQALATPTGRVTREHAYEVRGMLGANYADVTDEQKGRIEKDNDLSDFWHFDETPLSRRGDVWDNRRIPVKS